LSLTSDRCCVKGSLLEVNDRLIKHSKFAELFSKYFFSMFTKCQMQVSMRVWCFLKMFFS
jgi:hypothetical protein